MGNHEKWLHPRGGGLLANGLLPNAGPLLDSLDSVRWLKAEERTAELIACIQPNQPSEERRNAVADYVQRLIMKCFPCQVFTFGSVPLKTYLPDGDIDLTAFSNNANMKDSWATEVRDMLQTEEKNENAEFRVKEVQYIQAEVKIIKCLVENIVVDISFNQLGGLCTLCFLEEVDNLINHNHLFKRSIILIKAWCYYESRILGAHHGLISTYALETLVLYIFHVFNNSFAGPLEVLFRFLEFFSIFDWENFCVSLWGPVPISSLPDVTAETPRKDSGELLLNKVFLDACSSVYAVFPSGLENQGQTFVSKHFNVIDPLRVSNNLGRSVSKSNFFRIRSAFNLGAKNLAKILDCPQENLVAEVNQFFTNTWDRHGSGIRPDAPDTDPPLYLNPSVVENLYVTDILKINSSGKKSKEFIGREDEFVVNRFRNSSRTQNQKGRGNLNRGHKNLIASQIQLVNGIQRSPFARTHSSPELTKSGKSQIPGPNNRRKNVESELPNHIPTHLGFGGSGDSNNGSIGAHVMRQEQDLVNMMASQVHMPMGHLPFPLPPSFLAGMGYAQRNFSGMVPANFPMIDPMQFQHGLVSPQLTQFFSSFGMTSNEDSVEPSNESCTSVELSSVDADRVEISWQEQDLGSTGEGFEPNGVRSEVVELDNKRSLVGLNYVPPPRRVGGAGGLVRSQHKYYNKEKRVPLKDDDLYSEERTTSSRFSAAHTNSLKSKTSSESSWDETSTVKKSTKENRGKKPVVSSSGYVKGKTMSEDDELEMSFDTTDRTAGHLSESMIPMNPMIIGPNSRQRMTDNSGATPLTFYPTGPPVPFLTMLPFYNVPSQPNPSDPSRSHSGNQKSIENGDVSPNFYNSLRGPAPGETLNELKVDILNSDFASHWQNLQFGRLCQSPCQHGPMVFPSPSMVPPIYLQGRVPLDGSGRPAPNMNLGTQLMNYGPRLIPVTAPVQSSSSGPNVYQHQRYVEDLPRYRSGTGTYLPNPKVAVRERNFSGPRRASYNHDRSDNNIDREGNWNANSKSRGSSRNPNRNQTDKSNRSTSSYRHGLFSTYQTQNGSLHPSSSQNDPGNVVYGMCANPNGASSNGSTVPSMVMVHPYEHNTGFGTHSESLELGSVGQVGLSGVNDLTARVPFEEHRLYGSSPDRPSSPHHQRRV